ncbi:MAG: RodZ domain-containing protein [Gammaproteobacteria bacterium]
MSDAELEKPSVSVGQKLKTLRESKNIGTLEVASRLHLDIRIVNALEDDDYSALPDPIYIRGYIRNYSKLVGADADELVRLYDGNDGIQEPEIIPEIKYPSQSSSSDKPVKAFTYLITLGLVVLLIAWWQSNFIIEIQPPTDEQPARIAEPAGDNLALQETIPPLPDYTPAMPVQVPVELLDIQGEPADITSASNNDLGHDAVPVTAGEVIPGNDVSSGPVNEDSQGLTANVSPDDSASVNLDSTVPDQNDGPDSITLNVTDDSWVEITDGNNDRIFMDLVRSGDSLVLRGTAPFNVLLGFAEGVSVEFNDVPFDPEPYTRAGVARFTLGE